MPAFDYYFRKQINGPWTPIDRHDVPDEAITPTERGLTFLTKAGQYQARPRIASSHELLAAARELQRTLEKARRNGDWLHPATQLAIELAHDRYRILSDLPQLPPIVPEAATRKRWQPHRSW